MPFRYAPTPWEFIKTHLQSSGENYVLNMLKAYNQELKSREESKGKKLKPCSYQTFSRYIWVLRKLGLIYMTRKEPVQERPELHDITGKTTMIAGAHRHFYALVTDKISDISWANPMRSLGYPKG